MGDLRSRSHPRVETRLPVEVHGITRPGVAKGHLADLSLGGAALELDRPLRLGEEVAVLLQEGQAEADETEGQAGEGLASATRIKTSLEVRGEVVWIAWAELGGVRVGLRLVTQGSSLERFLTRALGASSARSRASTA